MQLAVVAPRPEPVEAGLHGATSVEDYVGMITTRRQFHEERFAASVEAAIVCAMEQVACEAHSTLNAVVRCAFVKQCNAASQRLADALAERDRLYRAYQASVDRVGAARRAVHSAQAAHDRAVERLGPAPVCNLSVDPVEYVREQVFATSAMREGAVSALALALQRARNGEACLTAKVARARDMLRLAKATALQKELDEAHRQVAVLVAALEATGGPAALAASDPQLSARSMLTDSSFESFEPVGNRD